MESQGWDGFARDCWFSWSLELKLWKYGNTYLNYYRNQWKIKFASVLIKNENWTASSWIKSISNIVSKDLINIYILNAGIRFDLWAQLFLLLSLFLGFQRERLKILGCTGSHICGFFF